MAVDIPQRRLVQTEIPGPRSKELHEKRQKNITNGFGITLPIFVEASQGAILRDVDGNQLIDLASGIAVTSIGASVPEVVAAITEQAERFTHTCFMVTEYEPFLDVCAMLNEITPGDFEKKTALFTTGAEAVENAVKIARSYTGRDAVVVLDHGYHGRTNLTMGMTAKNVPYKDGFGPFAPEIYRAPMAYPYRWNSGPEKAAEEALAKLKEIVTTQVGADRVAAIVAEPLQGEGGFIVPAPGFLKGVQDFAREHGIVFVSDEIQTGFARTGSWFYSEQEGLEPDLITTAKALAGGMPLSAVTGRAEIMDAAKPGGLGGTYAGNPVACAAALASFEYMKKHDLPAKARWIEDFTMPRLEKLVADGTIVGEARGKGAMLAIEFVKPGTKDPNPDATKAVAAAMHAEGVLTLTCGTFGNVIRMLPPLVIEEDVLDDALTVLERAVKDVAAQAI